MGLYGRISPVRFSRDVKSCLKHRVGNCDFFEVHVEVSTCCVCCNYCQMILNTAASLSIVDCWPGRLFVAAICQLIRADIIRTYVRV